MKSSLLAVAVMASVLLCACSKHHYPSDNDIKSALEDGSGITVSNLNIHSCTRRNNVDEGQDWHFDQYGCSYSATISGSKGTTKIEAFDAFRQGADGTWYVTP
jgi:hypothetical protein